MRREIVRRAVNVLIIIAVIVAAFFFLTFLAFVIGSNG